MPLELLTRSSESTEIPSPNPSFDCDVAIVGAGIVGATLAAALKNSGMKVMLIEAQSQSTAAARQQVYAISILSGQIFQELGIWDKILPKIQTFTKIHLSDADYPGVVQFKPQDLNRDALGYVGEHRVLISALQEFLNECPHVTWVCPAEVVNVNYREDCVEIRVKFEGEMRLIRSKLLVAADGAGSPIRQAAGIKTHGWKYWQSCITTCIKPEKSHDSIAYERFWPSGPLAILPLPGNFCNIVWTAPHQEAKALMELDDEEFLAELSRRYGNQMGRLELVGKRSLFQVQLMQSDRYVLPRLALIGDAAHCCHPVGGQGLNLGIRDAAALAQVLQNANASGKDIGSLSVLLEYQRWRQLENLTILGFTDFLVRIFSNNWFPLVVLRRLGLWMLRNIQPFKVFALRLMTGLLGRAPQIDQR
ncbi:MAG: FAD-dependent hydroxylase [Oscillatoriaceae bacterium SKW80]|nr:FAD-dependent hydroxylase [Oscillatoriaceae bacterium SKYG93]MCX8121157.1 FAD-dependent hydroxylase [Oscillatoriaceae bacterium SKW80]MDW8453513.1 FAD-dependent hydroxylase [Oscillatoriaceae cyanobacterium SKYGB_i_bin93]HIK26863.1 FAD-dependent hydroxylase [Oscillatoriaceae cyanobacterium M7585_C2015_266]